jgi:inner membrane protein
MGLGQGYSGCPMDPLSQAVLGAAAPQSIAPREHAKMAGILGIFGGMAPDLDVLIRSSTDPLLFLEYHRQFTHSLIFIPIGGLLVALALFALLRSRWQLPFSRYVLYCTLGYATHALLDSCTTYGTMLFWPFSDVRIAWNTVSVIDPLFTLPILILVTIAALRKQPQLARFALAWALLYPTLGMLQRDRAEEAGWALAQQRGHTPIKLAAKPSFGNILVWKVVYETEQRYYVDAVRTGLSTLVYPGDSLEKLELTRDFPWLQPDTQQALDVERFRWFSNGYLAKDPLRANNVIDIRYSMVPNRATGLWSIQLNEDATADQHVGYRTQRNTDSHTTQAFWNMLRGALNPESISGE